MRLWTLAAPLSLAVFASATTSAVAQQGAAPAVEPARLALAQEIVAVILPPDQRQQIMAAVLHATMQNMVAGVINGTTGLKEELATKPRVRAVFDRFVARQQSLAEADINAALPGLTEAYARAYARMFDDADLRAIRTFVITPAGTRFMQRSNAILSDPDVAAWQRRITEQGAGRQRTELATLQADLKAANLESGQ